MRSTYVEIKKKNLRHNVMMIRRAAPGSAMIGVVKANAYGHGLVGVANVLRQEGVEYLGVAFPEEGMELRRAGDDGPVVCIVPVSAEDAPVLCEYRLQTTVCSLEVLREFSREALKRHTEIKTHLFINSGMNRDGIVPDKALDFMIEASKLPGVQIIGICTHFATSDSDDKTLSLKQLATFNYTIKMLEDAGYSFKYRHASNSAGLVNIPEANLNMIRPGLAIYGYMADKKLADALNLKPILTLKSRVLLLQNVQPGDTVGYSLKYISQKSGRIAIVPFGYGDGFFRSFTNKSYCLINGKKYRVVGSICMDQCMVDIDVDDVKEGDEAIFIGTQGNESIFAYELAEMINTIPWEITTAIANRVPRLYIEE